MANTEDDYLEWFVEKEWVEAMEAAGMLCLKGDKVKKGWPDQFCFMPGPRTVVVEFKKFSAKRRLGEKLQDYYRGLFKGMGYEVYKVTGKEEADALRDNLLS